MNDVVTAVKNDVSWLKQHERMVIVLCLIVASVWGWNTYINYRSNVANVQYGVTLEASKEAKEAAAVAAQNYQATIEALSKQNAALAQAVATRQVQLVEKQTEIKTVMPLPDVTAEWQRLIGGVGDFAPRMDGVSGVTVTEDATRKTVSQLEAVPVLTANLADTQKIVSNKQDEIDKANTVIAAKDNEIAASDSLHKAELSKVKADAAKSKRKYFVFGFITGLATRILTKW